MFEIEKLHIGWIDCSNNDEKEVFLDALNSYLFFKKDGIDKCDLLIKNNIKFNAPKLLKIILILLSRDKHKIHIANTLFKKINIKESFQPNLDKIDILKKRYLNWKNIYLTSKN